VLHVLKPDDDLGTGFIMQRVAGETIPRKILRDDEFAGARPKLARQCGEILAGIHGLSAASLPQLRRMNAAAEIAELQREIDGFGWPRPVFQLALRWLRDHDPGPSERVTLVHGDFRHGNLMIGPDGVRAVLDWELAHLGDPMEDLGWICVNSWRFGVIDKPVGGFGTYEELFSGYEAASGIAVDVARVKFWEVMGTLRWGVMCVGMMQRFRSRTGSFDGARDDRPALVGDGDRSVTAIGAARMIPNSGDRFSDQIMRKNKVMTCRTNRGRTNW
jgi:aminoglycoside phosphotransferase (APT) family kinase protein